MVSVSKTPSLFLRWLALFFLLSSIGLLASCDANSKKSTFIGHDISGTGLGKHLAMQDSNGQLRTLADFEGKIVIVFFGFTQCPDVCPTALSQLAQAVNQLGEKADQVQVIMITVDPERDTGAVLQDYVQLFHPDFIGLTGTAEQLHKTAQSFKAFYVKVPSLDPNQYNMDHSAAFYLIDRHGQARSLLNGDASPDDLAHDIQLLLDEGH